MDIVSVQMILGPVAFFAIGCLLAWMVHSRKRDGNSSLIDRQNAEIEVKRQEIAQYNDKLDACRRAEKFLEERPTLEAEQKQIVMDIAAKESRYKNLADDIKRLEESSRKQEAKISEKKAALDLVVKDLEAIEREVSSGCVERDSLKKRIEGLKEDNKELSATNNGLKAGNKILKEKCEELKSAKEKMAPQVSDLERRKVDAEKWLKDNSVRLARMDDLDHAIAQREKAFEVLGENLETAQKRLEEVMKAVERGIDRLTKMNLSGVQTLRLSSFEGLKNGDGAFTLPNAEVCEKAFGADDEVTALAAVAAHFKASGFEVPDRLLRAFHTSLKTSDMSCLTVMAGVSGTGKSAIPKLYSEAMGIFFRPLAVEPRWDSPKDLMGFFNYVTNRYEPTPLARAMFQFQGLWDDDFSPDQKLDEYMFMPLLDEMNLARIEYYFSEFLSKLEMRRLVARDGKLKKEDVPLIGLEIFGGCHRTIEGKNVNEAAKYLFANTNTLFVGTMNEDETTQSLSDKVIDRANVLYFGKPSTLKSNQGGGNKAKRRAPLRRDVWTRWCKPVDGGALTQATEVLTSLNNQLAMFNRPFAHRTYQAMLAYIANYPAVEVADDNERIRVALADQIGMRIMPKLRGLELNQNMRTLKEIGAILSDARLNDGKLTTAFEQAIAADKGSGFFRWNGFDW